MPLEATGKLIPRKFKSKGKEYVQWTISIPSALAKDSQFPFKLKKSELEIEISGDNLIISPVYYECEICLESDTEEDFIAGHCEECGQAMCKGCIHGDTFKMGLCPECDEDMMNRD